MTAMKGKEGKQRFLFLGKDECYIKKDFTCELHICT